VAAILYSGPVFAALTAIPTLPTWDSRDEYIGVGNYFAEDWVVTKPSTSVLVTDLYVPGDNYNVYRNGVLVATTNVADCTAYAGGCTVGGPVYAPTAAAGWASSIFAHAKFGANAGDIITIQAIAIPTGFSDSTVAITQVPEPATWAMMLMGFAGLGFAGYRRAKTAPAS
jgi:hypothetical protein